MNSVLADFGLGSEALASQIEAVDYPKPKPGRVAHIDADFLAYQVSAETRDELDGIKPRKSFEEMQHNARQAAEHLMRSAGATKYVCHITASSSTKGGRAGQAIQQEYQANRKDAEKPEFLDKIRAYFGQELNGIVHLDQEADDGMAQANYEAQGTLERDLTVIVSKDKDLLMVPGYHYDWDSGKVTECPSTFGHFDVKTTAGGSKKPGGRGTAFFWAQCLMGDTADNIKGLPEVPGSIWTQLDPTKAYAEAYKVYTDSDDQAKADKAEQKIDAIRSKTKKCGLVLASKFLTHVKNDRDAFKLVREAWTRLETEHGYEFKHWRTGERVTPTQALLGDMQLLWMRRNKNPTDVVDWIKEVMA